MSGQLGDWITINGAIVRTGDASNFKRFWEAYDIEPALRVMIVGQRTLSDGYVERFTETDGWSSYTTKTWFPERHFTAYLVVSNLWTKPFFVLPEQIVEEAL